MGEKVDHSARNEVENLLEDEHIGPGWWCFVHNTLPSGRDFNSTPAHFFAASYAFLWDGCESKPKKDYIFTFHNCITQQHPFNTLK